MAIIPARAGSKRLPGKNTKLFHGKPLVEWSVIAAVGSKYIDRLVISSDIDFTILADKYGVSYQPRPRELAFDDTPIEEVAQCVIDCTRGPFDMVILLQPTSPLRDSVDIDNAIESFFAPLDSLISFVHTDGQLKPNGAIYIKRTNRILQGDKFYQPHDSKIFLMPPGQSIDIDTQSDFDEALNASQNENPTT